MLDFHCPGKELDVATLQRACVITSPDERLKIKILIPAEKQLHSILFL